MYHFRVNKKFVDGHEYFVGTVDEFPDVVVFEDSAKAARSELFWILDELFAAAARHGRKFPKLT